jgi:hypothetical protein
MRVRPGVELPPKGKTPPGQLRVPEKAFTRQIADAARLFGWMRYHAWLAVNSPAGWPDEALVRGDRLILAELKAIDGVPTERQATWLYALAAVPGIEVYLWRPPDLEEIKETLR